jgi:hypothetical protein
MATDSDAAAQRILTEVWREVLQSDRFGPDDNFFDLGGTSLEAVVVVALLNRELGADVSGIGLFERPTIRAMTDLLRGTERPGPAAQEARRRGARRRTAGPARRRASDER